MPGPPLSETDILERHGSLMWAAVCAFSGDPQYFSQMSEAANLIEYKRQLWKVRIEALGQSVSPELPSKGHSQAAA